MSPCPGNKHKTGRRQVRLTSASCNLRNLSQWKCTHTRRSFCSIPINCSTPKIARFLFLLRIYSSASVPMYTIKSVHLAINTMTCKLSTTRKEKYKTKHKINNYVPKRWSKRNKHKNMRTRSQIDDTNSVGDSSKLSCVKTFLCKPPATKQCAPPKTKQNNWTKDQLFPSQVLSKDFLDHVQNVL